MMHKFNAHMLDLNIRFILLIYCVNIKCICISNSCVHHHKTAHALLLSQHMLIVNITKTGLIGNSFIKQIQKDTHVQSVFLQLFMGFVVLSHVV